MRFPQTIRQTVQYTLRVAAGATAIATAATLSTGATAQQAPSGQGGMSPAQQQEVMQKLEAKRQEISELNQKLAEIQEAAIEANPELAQKREDWMDLVDTKMEEAGHNPDQQLEKIENLRGKLENEDLSQQESQRLAQQLRSEQGNLQQAQREILQDEEVQSERTALNEEMIAAMKEQNPETAQIIASLQKAQQEYRAIAQQAMQSSQGGGARPPQ